MKHCSKSPSDKSSRSRRRQQRRDAHRQTFHLAPSSWSSDLFGSAVPGNMFEPTDVERGRARRRQSRRNHAVKRCGQVRSHQRRPRRPISPDNEREIAEAVEKFQVALKRTSSDMIPVAPTCAGSDAEFSFWDPAPAQTAPSCDEEDVSDLRLRRAPPLQDDACPSAVVKWLRPYNSGTAWYENAIVQTGAPTSASASASLQTPKVDFKLALLPALSSLASAKGLPPPLSCDLGLFNAVPCLSFPDSSLQNSPYRHLIPYIRLSPEYELATSSDLAVEYPVKPMEAGDGGVLFDEASSCEVEPLYGESDSHDFEIVDNSEHDLSTDINTEDGVYVYDSVTWEGQSEGTDSLCWLLGDDAVYAGEEDGQNTWDIVW